MVIVTGTIQARPDTLDELLTLGRAHSSRSRAEPGCVSHSLHVDAEDPLRLFFFERWADRDALTTHFAVPESGDFVRTAMAMSDGPPDMTIYDVATA